MKPFVVGVDNQAFDDSKTEWQPKKRIVKADNKLDDKEFTDLINLNDGPFGEEDREEW